MAVTQQPTRVSFIDELTNGGDESWSRLYRVYAPLIRSYLRKFRFSSEDAADLLQEVLISIHENIVDFEHNGRVGAFRTWIRTITVNRARDHLRKRACNAGNTEEVSEMINQLADESSELTDEFNRQHDRYFLELLLERIAQDTEPETIDIFRMHVLEEVDAAKVASVRGITRGAVYVTKSRVLRRLRALAQEIELA